MTFILSLLMAFSSLTWAAKTAKKELIEPGLAPAKSWELRGPGCPKTAQGATMAQQPTGARWTLPLETTFAVKTEAKSKTARKNCSMSIPFHVPPQQKLVLEKVEILGRAMAREGAKGSFQIEVFSPGKKAIPTEKLFESGPNGSLWQGMISASQGQGFSSDCGKDGVIRINLSAVTKTESNKGEAKALVETVEFIQKYEPCGEKPTS